MSGQILVVGATGYVGGMIYRFLRRGYEVVGISASGDAGADVLPFDLGSPDACRSLADRFSPSVVVNAAGYKDVAGCERDRARAYRQNALLVGNLCSLFGTSSTIVHVSSDYVFSGETGGYAENSPPTPSTVYGLTKAAGELIGRSLCDDFRVLRVAALYDLDAPFLAFLLGHFRGGRTAECFTDVRYSPTYYRDFLALLEAVIDDTDRAEAPRLLHACGESISRYEFARVVADVFGFDRSLVEGKPRGPEQRSLLADTSLISSVALGRYGLRVHSHREALIELKGE